MKKYIPLLRCFVSGILLTFAFAPFYVWPLAIVAMASLAWQQQSAAGKHAALLAYVFGMGFFGTSVYWVYISIHVYGDMGIAISALLTLGFIMVLACFTGLQGLLLGSLFKRAHPLKLLIGFPCTWVLSEWLRSWVLTGFPWVLLGYSQTNSLLKGFAPLLGVYGTSLVICWLACLLVYAITYRTKRWFAVAGIILLLIIGALLNNLVWTHPRQKTLSVSLLQGNVPQSLKWSETEVEENKTLYRAMTLPHLSSDLIVWPESAITAPPWYVADYLMTLAKQAKQHHTAIIVGLPISNPDTPDVYYNGLITLGNGQGGYLKRHLVPLGEYVPLESWLRNLRGFFDLPMSDLTPGASQQPPITAAGINIATFICYEIAYGELVYPSTRNTQLLITMSDDTWFGRSVAPYQHLQIGQWRALETGRPLLFVANTGTTAIVDAKGRITQQLPLFVKASLVGTVQPMDGITPIMRYGQMLILIFVIVLLGGAWFLSRMRKHTHST